MIEENDWSIEASFYEDIINKSDDEMRRIRMKTLLFEVFHADDSLLSSPNYLLNIIEMGIRKLITSQFNTLFEVTYPLVWGNRTVDVFEELVNSEDFGNRKFGIFCKMFDVRIGISFQVQYNRGTLAYASIVWTFIVSRVKKILHRYNLGELPFLAQKGEETLFIAGGFEALCMPVSDDESS